MKAVVYEDVRTVGVRDVADATIEADSDAVVRVTSSAICGTDLHLYDGRTGASARMVLGHEPLGVVEQVGRAVETITAGMGPYRGAQAQLLRVPWADANCIRLPGEPGDSYEDDFVLLADAFVTGWHATTLADVHAGDTVAVFGAGTIGLRDLITSGRARPGTIVTHHGTLDDAPELNQQFDKRENGVIKAVLHPCSTHDSGRSGSVGPSRMTIIRRRDEGYGGSSLFGHPGPTVCCRPKLAIGNPKLSRPFPLRR